MAQVSSEENIARGPVPFWRKIVLMPAVTMQGPMPDSKEVTQRKETKEGISSSHQILL